jgi:hypothetical protein
VNSPIVRGPLVFTTVGAGRGGDLIRLKREGDKFAVEELCSNKNLANHHGNVVLFDGHLYGASEVKGWICQSLESGEVVWTAERGKLPTGSVTYADGRFYCYGERNGSVTLLEASSKAFNVISKFVVSQKSSKRKPAGGLWTPPVVANGRLFLRDQELVFCHEVQAGR